MSEISLHKDFFKCGVIYNMSPVDVYAPPRGRCHFGTQPVAMHHNLLPAGELGNVGEFRDLPRVFNDGVDAACTCGVPLHVAMTRLCRLSKSTGICAGRSSCSVLWAVAVAARRFWCWWPQCCGNDSGDGEGDNGRCWQQRQQRLEKSHCRGRVM